MPAPTPFLVERHARVRAHLDALGLDALVVTHPSNILYLTNHAASAGTLVLTRDAVHLLSDFRYAEAVRRRQSSPEACPDLTVRQVPASYDEALVAALAELGVRRAGIEALHLTVARLMWLEREIAARGLAIVFEATEGLVEGARVRKDEWELAALREASSRLSEVAALAFEAVRPGVVEREVAAAIEAGLRRAGFERPAFDTIVASGPHGALPHYRAGDRRLDRGDLVVLDFGGVLDGYCSDLTRTVALGSPAPDAIRVYEAVRDAQAAAIAAVRPGIAPSAVDAAARGVLEERGLGEAFGHGTGHGLGLEVHEAPRITRPRPDLDSAVLEPGMVFTIEPGAYLAGWGGVRIEDDVAVTASGCDVLTSVTRDLVVR